MRADVLRPWDRVQGHLLLYLSNYRKCAQKIQRRDLFTATELVTKVHYTKQSAPTVRPATARG